MASFLKKSVPIQSSATQATVSHVQTNPISIRRPQAFGAEVDSMGGIPAPAPSTRMIIPGVSPVEYSAVVPHPDPIGLVAEVSHQMEYAQPVGETLQTPQSLEQAMMSASQDPVTAAFDSSLTSLADIPYYSLSQIITNHRSLIPTNDSDLPVLDDEADAFDAFDDSRYSNEEKVGEGGTSIVYLANDSRLRRKVALKRFKQISRNNDESDYLNELERTSSISHPYVVSAYDADVDRKGRFIVMEFINGVDMEVAIGKKQVSFDLNRFTNFAHKALEGLDAIHQAGLLHLDLKPANIMLDIRDSGRDLVKLIDFGRSRPTQDDEGNVPRGLGLNGSILYSAPEQLLSEDLDKRTDIYALGCVFYWVLTGTRPYDGPNPVTIMSTHLRHLVTDIAEIIPTLPRWLARLIMSMISLEKNDRPASAQAIIDILDTDGEVGKVARFQA